jgi:predicted metal-dependent hydrolase
LFNAGLFFEAHEALEAAWRDESGPVRSLYCGILQIGVVYLHITRHNYPGAIKVFHRCQKWLQLWPETCRGVSVGQLRQDLETAISSLKDLGPQHIAEFDMSLLKPVQYSRSENR